MSTVLIVIIVVVVLIVVAMLVSAANRRKHTHQIAEAQVEAKHDDVDHHREQARDARAEAELADERSKRAAAEADLNERQASEREQELK
jgi:FtsZ-interacting cell division protein ZipA